MPTPDGLAGHLADHLRRLVDSHDGPSVVGLDGRSGSGKSTLAVAVTRLLAGQGIEVTVIEADQFYGGGSSATWDRRTVESNAARVMDWRRQRDVLLALRHEGAAEWRPFDWDADDWEADEVPLAESVQALVAPLVVLEGAYSCRPELHDLLDLRVLLDVPVDVRRRQLLEREGEGFRADWEARWSAAEDHYFGTVMPPEAFDVVLGTGPASTGHLPGR